MRTRAKADPGRSAARRQRRRTAFLFAALGLVGALALVWAAAHLFTGHSLWARAIAWGASDIGDVRRFLLLPGSRYGYLWWVNPQVERRDHFLAAGKHGQFVYVAPEEGLIVVRFGRADRFGAMAGRVADASR